MILATVGVALIAAADTHQQDLVIYNPSNSVPAGFYVRSDRPLERGALVTVRAVSVAPASRSETTLTRATGSSNG